MDRRSEDDIQTAIVILHYIKEDLTKACIQSIKENTLVGSYQIYVVDNNSPVPFILEEPFVTVIRNSSRYSTSGMNFGFYHALYESTWKHQYVVNIDNDVLCHKGWLEPLVNEMESHPNTGICGGKQWNKYGTEYNSVGSDLIGYIYNSWPIERTEVNWIQGSFTMYRADMMKQIGLHDTRYQDYCSDSDYCIHALDRGWDVVFVPESNVTHLGGVSYKEFLIDRADDLGALKAKWFGTKFNSLANVLPINSNGRIYGQVTYKETRR